MKSDINPLILSLFTCMSKVFRDATVTLLFCYIRVKSHQNSPSSCTVTPSFSRSLLLTLFHSSELPRAKTNVRVNPTRHMGSISSELPYYFVRISQSFVYIFNFRLTCSRRPSLWKIDTAITACVRGQPQIDNLLHTEVIKALGAKDELGVNSDLLPF